MDVKIIRNKINNLNRHDNKILKKWCNITSDYVNSNYGIATDLDSNISLKERTFIINNYETIRDIVRSLETLIQQSNSKIDYTLPLPIECNFTIEEMWYILSQASRMRYSQVNNINKPYIPKVELTNDEKEIINKWTSIISKISNVEDASNKMINECGIERKKIIANYDETLRYILKLVIKSKHSTNKNNLIKHINLDTAPTIIAKSIVSLYW